MQLDLFDVKTGDVAAQRAGVGPARAAPGGHDARRVAAPPVGNTGGKSKPGQKRFSKEWFLQSSLFSRGRK